MNLLRPSRLAQTLGIMQGLRGVDADSARLLIHDRAGVREVLLRDLLSIEATRGWPWGSLRLGTRDGEIALRGLRSSDLKQALEPLRHAAAAARRERATLILQSHAGRIEAAVVSADRLLAGQHYLSAARAGSWQERAAPLADALRQLDLGDPSDSGYESARRLLQIANGLEALRREQNERFIAREVRAPIFDSLDRSPTDEQRLAVLTAEDNVLVVAGAGTGKTQAITAKIAYAVRVRGIEQSQVLAIAYTRAAQREMEERLTGMGLGGVKVSTFHALGLEMLAAGRGRKPSLSRLATDAGYRASELARLIQDVALDPRHAAAFQRFMLELYYPRRTEEEFTSIEDYYRALKSYRPRALSGDAVKSFEELQIANFLFRNGVRFEYEASYRDDTATRDYRQYRPDFYLPDYEIYIEHFGLDAAGNPPSRYSYAERLRYVDGVRWKRALHMQHGTDLIETFSHQQRAGTLLSDLERALLARGVEFDPLPPERLLEAVNAYGLTDGLTQLVQSILTHVRSHRLSITELKLRAQSLQDPERALAFVALFAPVYRRYTELLKQAGEVDFEDMIARGTAQLERKTFQSPWQLVIVDEFQDIAADRAALLKALTRQVEFSELFCVGDDWQSIYRFTGSDVSIMREFSDEFGATAQLRLTETFRFNDQIARVSEAFILANPEQLPKQLRVRRTAVRERVVLLRARAREAGVAAALEWIVADGAGKAASVLLLGRYRHSVPASLAALRRRYSPLTLEFSTVHAAKGREADYVVTVDLVTDRYGFPSQIEDDPLLDLVLPRAEPFPHAEERRLFYVALTRAREAVVLVADATSPSVFVEELIDQGLVGPPQRAAATRSHICPRCSAGSLRLMTGANGQFFGCTNFPFCDYADSACSRCGKGRMVLDHVSPLFVCEVSGCGHTEEACPRCERGRLIERVGRNGPFLGCTGYGGIPPCDHTQNVAARGRGPN